MSVLLNRIAGNYGLQKLCRIGTSCAIVCMQGMVALAVGDWLLAVQDRFYVSIKDFVMVFGDGN